MSKLILKKIDFGADSLCNFSPPLADNFCIWLDLSIGSEDKVGENLFQVGVCTTTWLAHEVSIKKLYVLRHMLLIEKFDAKLIQKSIENIIEESQRMTAEETLKILCRYFFWEFEGYKTSQ